MIEAPGLRQDQHPDATGWSGEAAFRALTGILPGPVLLGDRQGAGLYANASFQAYAGCSAEALLGSGWLGVVDERDRDGLAAAWHSALAGGEPQEASARLVSARGDRRWHLWRITPLQGDGPVPRWIGHATDVHDAPSAAGRGGEATRTDDPARQPDGSHYPRNGIALPASGSEGRPGHAVGGAELLDPGHHATLRSLDDRLRGLADPEKAKGVAAAALGRALGAGRVTYAEVDEDRGVVRIGQSFTQGTMPDAVGEYPLSALEPALGVWRSGQTLAVADLRTDPRMGAISDLPAVAATRTCAVLDVPLVKDGRLVAILSVHHPEPHPWALDEVTLAEAVAERTWAVVEHARSLALLRERDVRLEAVVDSAGLGTWHWTLATNTFRFGLHWGAMLGYEEAEIPAVAARWDSVVHPEDRPALDQAVREHLEGRTPVYRSEHRLRHKDGRWIWVLDSGRVTERDRDGHPLAITGTHLDITARKEAEAALSERERFLQALIDALPDCVKVCTPDGRLLDVNPAGLAILDAPAFEPLRGHDPRPLVADEDRETWTRTQGRAAAGDAPDWIEFGITSLAGRRLRLEGCATPVRDARGTVDAVLWVTRDITERKAAEEALRQSEARWRNLFEHMHEGVGLGEIVRDEGGAAVDVRFLEVNSGFERQSALPASVVGRPITKAIPGFESFWIELYARVTETGEPAHAEYHAAPLNRWFEARAHRTGPDRFATLFLDITARREAEAALAESQARLVRLNAGLEARVAERTASLAEAARALEAEMRRREEAQGRLVQAQKMEALGQLVGGVAHDFNNILAAVQGAFAMLDRRVGDERLRFVIAEGRKAGDRATSLVRQMLAFARRERLEPQVIEPAERLPGLVSMIHHAAGPRVECGIEVSAGVWPILADPQQLEVALLNLAVNARDAMPEGGTLTLSARNLPAGRPRPAEVGDGDHVVIAVSDTGQGMDAATAARACEPFFTTKGVGQGTGLGLAQVHGFVQGSGGALRIDSAPGKGTTVSLFMPRSALEPTVPSAARHDVAERHGGATILLVDDDEQVRPITAALLHDLGYTVVEAPSGAAALALAQLHPVDLLLTDVVMPGMDGPALAATLRAERPGLPVLFFTGYAGRHQLDGEAVVAKPFTGEELGRQVLDRLGRGEAGAAPRR